mgnify:CR=1
KWTRRVLQRIDDYPLPDLASREKKRTSQTEASVLLEIIAEKRKDLKGIPKVEDGGIVKILTKTLTKSLTDELSISLTESISSLLHERMAK